MITVITAPDLGHIEERHGPNGSAEDKFDQNFLQGIGGYGKIVKAILDYGDGASEYDKSGRLIYKYYYNFNKHTGTGIDKFGKSITFKGAEMVGTISGQTFWVETTYPKGIMK